LPTPHTPLLTHPRGATVASLTFAATGRNYILTFAAASVFPCIALLWMVKVRSAGPGVAPGAAEELWAMHRAAEAVLRQAIGLCAGAAVHS